MRPFRQITLVRKLTGIHTYTHILRQVPAMLQICVCVCVEPLNVNCTALLQAMPFQLCFDEQTHIHTHSCKAHIQICSVWLLYVCMCLCRALGVAISKLYNNNNSNSNKCTNAANWNSSIQRYPAVCRNRFLSRTPLDSASLGRQQLLNVAWRIVTWRCKCAACTARLLCFARLGLVIGLVCVLLPAS